MTNQPRTTSSSNQQPAKDNDTRYRAIQPDTIDFIARVPCDVLSTLASFLSKDALNECIQISSVWRERIVSCPAFWESVELRSDYTTPVLQLLPTVAKHVQHLEICTPANCVSKIFHVIKSGAFTELQSLSISMTSSEWSELLRGYRTERGLKVSDLVTLPSLVVYSQFPDVLPNIATTLTKLKLTLRAYHEAPSLTGILSICRNLTYIDYQCKSFQNSKEFAMKHTTDLTYASLSTDPDNDISGTVLETLLESSPHIRSLTLKSCEHLDAISIIDRYPNKLTYLSINANRLTCPLPSPDNYDFDGEYQGLLCLIMIYGRSPSPSSLLRYLWQNCHSIQTLYLSSINYCIYGQFQEDTNGILSSPYANAPEYPTMKSLATLYISSMGGSDYWNALPSILRCAPNLHTLEIEDKAMYGEIPEVVVDQAVAEMKSISRLKLHDVRLCVSAQLRLLRHLATLPLAELYLLDCGTGDQEAVYMAVAGIKSLKKLWLRSILKPQSQRSSKQFIRDLRKLPHLEYVYIGAYTGDVWSRVHIDDEDLRSLCECMSLKTIHLENFRGYTQGGITMVRNRSPPIQLIAINPPPYRRAR